MQTKRSATTTAGPSNYTASTSKQVKQEPKEPFGGKRLCDLLGNKRQSPDDPNEQVDIDSFVGSIRHFTGNELDELLHDQRREQSSE